jgi:uncharacterized membrane protein
MINSLWLLSVALHILAAILLVGGQAFMILAMMPALREPEHRAVGRSMLLSAGRRFRKVSVGCLHLLLLTGLFNLWVRCGQSFDMKNPLMHAGMTKLVLWAIALGISIYHDKVIGRRAVEAWEKDPNGPETLALRRKSMQLGRVGFAIAVVLVLLGIWIVRPLS